MAISSLFLRGLTACSVLASLLAAPASAQDQAAPPTSAARSAAGQASSGQTSGGETPKIRLEDSESFFDIMAVLNACGYDQDLATSHPLRAQIRDAFAAQVNASDTARRDLGAACTFYRDHDFSGYSRNISRYISLAIELNPPPDFLTRVQEADLPPDASSILGIVPLVQRLYGSAKLHELWLKYQPAYEAEIERLHDPVSQKIRDTDFYLRMQVGSYLGRSFVVYVEPQAGPGEVDARQYGSDYFLVLSPSPKENINLDALRHIYLHYVIDAMVEKHGMEIFALQPLLVTVRSAPMDVSYRTDVALLTTESMIRAIEIRTNPRYMPPPKDAKESKEARRDREAARDELVDSAVAQGFVLARYFYDTLGNFEKGVAGFQDSFGDMVHDINVDREVKAANRIQFAKEAAPEVLAREKPTRPAAVPALDRAEQQLFAGDPEGASRIAQDALDNHQGDQGQALYVLARAASMSGKMTEAQSLFERTLQVATEPRVIAWSHIYLGRILDLQDDRDSAVKHYQAALAAGDPSQNTQAAAQQGIDKQYAKPAGAGEQKKQEGN